MAKPALHKMRRYVRLKGIHAKAVPQSLGHRMWARDASFGHDFLHMTSFTRRQAVVRLCVSRLAPRRAAGGVIWNSDRSFLSFHLMPGSPKTLLLTAQYRNHYYIEKLLGNLIGLGRLMAFVAHETGSKVGSLTVLSTHAQIDAPKASR
jgi:hypothetical protein